jgi:hypothetical protein
MIPKDGYKFHDKEESDDDDDTLEKQDRPKLRLKQLLAAAFVDDYEVNQLHLVYLVCLRFGLSSLPGTFWVWTPAPGRR